VALSLPKTLAELSPEFQVASFALRVSEVVTSDGEKMLVGVSGGGRRPVTTTITEAGFALFHGH
jgi:hypothetical protein